MKYISLSFFIFAIVAPAFAAEKAIDSRFVPANPGAPPVTPEPPTLGAKPPADIGNADEEMGTSASRLIIEQFGWNADLP